MLFTLCSILVTGSALACANDGGSLVRGRIRQAVASLLILLAYLLMALDYGYLRGMFVLLGLVSLLGMLVAVMPSVADWRDGRPTGE